MSKSCNRRARAIVRGGEQEQNLVKLSKSKSRSSSSSSSKISISSSSSVVQVGSQGSHEFIRGFLVPSVFRATGWPEFQGAIILDTIMNYNTSSGTQAMPDSWISRTEAVEEPEARGDFISLVSRRGPEKVRQDHVLLDHLDLPDLAICRSLQMP